MPNNNAVRLVLTGGPGSGKTVLMERLRTLPELAGFLFFDELARRILSAHPELRRDRTRFHREIYRQQVERENAAAGRSFVTDRGTVDAFAFHPETVTQVGTSLEAEYARYTGVIQLQSAAALGAEYYATDDIRNESVSDALQIEAAIKRVWSGHARYTLVPAEIDFEKKYGALRRVIVDYVQD